MNREKVWEDFTALPLEAQQQVADFIAFLRSRYRQLTPEPEAGMIDLANEAFIGMWRNCVDMGDSS